MKKYLFLFISLSLPNYIIAAESGSEQSGDSVSTESSGWERVAEQQERESQDLSDLIQDNLRKIYVTESADPHFTQLTRLLARKDILPEAAAVRVLERMDDVAESSLVVVYYDNSDEVKKQIVELSSRMAPESTLMIICKKRMNSEKFLPTPEGLKRIDTLKRVYGLPMAPQHQHIVLFEKT